MADEHDFSSSSKHPRATLGHNQRSFLAVSRLLHHSSFVVFASMLRRTGGRCATAALSRTARGVGSPRVAAVSVSAASCSFYPGLPQGKRFRFWMIWRMAGLPSFSPSRWDADFILPPPLPIVRTHGLFSWGFSDSREDLFI